MITLPLYPEAPRSPLETVAPLALNPECQRCHLHKRAKHVCLPADGDPGGLLVVGAYPGRDEDRRGAVMVGETGAWIRKQIAARWSGPVAYDNALRCGPVARGVDREALVDAVAACRGYLRRTVDEVRPRRILAVGGEASYSLLGRRVSPMSVRGGYGWLGTVPVFFLFHVAAAWGNRILRQWWLEDLDRALTQEPGWDRPWEAGASAYLVETPDEAEAACADLGAGPWFALDCEWRGKQYTPDFRLLTVACTPARGDRSYVWDQVQLARPELLPPLRAILRDPTKRKVGSYIKVDLHALALGLGVAVRGVHGDVQLGRHTLDPDVDGDLDTSAELVGMGGHKEEAAAAEQAAYEGARTWAAKRARRHVQPGLFRAPPDEEEVADPVAAARVVEAPKDERRRWIYALIPTDVRRRYAGRDSLATARAWAWVERQMAADPAIVPAWSGSMLPLAVACQQMEAWGQPVDVTVLDGLEAHLRARVAEIDQRLAPYAINPDSSDQVAALLYGKLGLPVPLKTPAGKPSTAEEALEALQGKHPIIADLLSRRSLVTSAKYTAGYREAVGPDGLIHCDFKPDGARSSRLSSSEPNLQNIKTTATDIGKWMRSAFVAEPGWDLISVDLSQIELRVGAHRSGDPAMQRIFLDRVDYHRRTAELIAELVWRLKPEELQKLHRDYAKTVNFGVAYRQGAESLAKKLGIPKVQAQLLIDAVLGAFRRYDRWRDEKIAETRRTGATWTYWQGRPWRRRYLPNIAEQGDDDTARRRRSTAETGAFNTDIQGSANEICVQALIDVVRWIREEGIEAKVGAVVHDQILARAPHADAVEVGLEIKRRMEAAGAWLSSVPIVADLEIGPSWGALVKVPPAGETTTHAG